MFEEKPKSLSLQVQEPDPTHVGRNIVTLDKKSKQFLGITSGDIVEIEGTKKTAAVVWPAKPEDENQGVVRMDNLLRHNAGVGLGEKVTMRRGDFKEAKKVVLAPTQEVRIIASGYDRILKKTFIGRAMHKGDHVWISVFGSGFIYAVVDTNPKGIVKITDFTQFILKEEIAKEGTAAIERISYEDIGGLNEPVRKVREMIELPMRHPELFTRLGIQPPKGVLLHGPPGTGKTLLAKAVASETQAHFISLSAPSVMCVEGKTPVLTNPKGTEPIEELFKKAEEQGKLINKGSFTTVALKKPQTVYSLSPDLKIKKGKITHITKLKARTVTIKTSLGEEVKVSRNQPFATMDGFGNVVWKTASELKSGELIAIAKVLPEGKSHTFKYLDDFDENAFVKTKNKVLKKTEFRGRYAEIKGIKRAVNKSNYVRASFITLPHTSSPALMRFLGLMYAEGNIKEDGIQFANQDPLLLREFSELAKDLFHINPKIKKDKVLCYSYTLRHYLTKTLGSPYRKKHDYSLPEWMFGVTKKETAAFIQGFWEGDGTTSKGVGGYPTMRIYSITRNVLEDLSVLARKVGFVCKIVPWKTRFSDMLALVFQGNRSRELFYENIKSNVKKYELIEQWYVARKKKGDDFRIPALSPLLKEIKLEKKLVYGKNFPEGATERYVSGRDPLTQRKLEEICQCLPTKNKKLEQLVNAETAWAKITGVKETGETELFDLKRQYRESHPDVVKLQANSNFLKVASKSSSNPAGEYLYQIGNSLSWKT